MAMMIGTVICFGVRFIQNSTVLPFALLYFARVLMQSFEVWLILFIILLFYIFKHIFSVARDFLASILDRWFNLYFGACWTVKKRALWLHIFMPILCRLDLFCLWSPYRSWLGRLYHSSSYITGEITYLYYFLNMLSYITYHLIIWYNYNDFDIC